MDPLTAFLNGPRARSAFLIRTVMDGPFAMRIEDRSPLTVLCVSRGRVVVVPSTGGAEPVELSEGDVALVRGDEPYVVADAPDTAASIVIREGQRCETLNGEPLADQMGLGVRTWGSAPDGATVLLTGTYEHGSALSAPLLEVLPPVVAHRAERWACPLVPLHAGEIGRDEPGQEVVLDRLLDLLTVSALRTWLTTMDVVPGWFAAAEDPVVGPALRALHADPARPWTVDALARVAHVSRAGLARRFSALVGATPIGYLTQVRLALAADLLRDPGARVSVVATEVGYANPFSFSAAFKRAYGHSPSEHRTLAA